MMDPVVFGELFTAIQQDPGLTSEQRDAAQQTLLFNYFAQHLGPLPATTEADPEG
jgi:hypothetical protein